MSSISWNSTSLNNYFNTSLGRSSSSDSMSSLYSSLSDASMIKSGSYKKLMRSYFNEVQSDSKTSDSKSSSSSKSSSDTSSTNQTSSKSSSSSSSSSKSRHACTYTYDSKKSTISTIRNSVLDDLLDKTPKKSSITNPVLDELLGKNKTTTEDGTVTEKTDDTAAETTDATSVASEAAAGAIIDEAV